MSEQDEHNSISRRSFLRRAGLVGLGLLGSQGLAQVALAGKSPIKHPDIVFLLADQWRASATGYGGDPNVKTPNLDRLAGESVNFRSAISVCPVCTPYRAALLTGRYPTSTGMLGVSGFEGWAAGAMACPRSYQPNPEIPKRTRRPTKRRNRRHCLRRPREMDE